MIAVSLVYHFFKIYLMSACTIAVLLTCSPHIVLAEQKVTNFVLDNGLEVVVIEDHRAPVVVHSLWYKAGAADEEPGKSGALAARRGGKSTNISRTRVGIS